MGSGEAELTLHCNVVSIKTEEEGSRKLLWPAHRFQRVLTSGPVLLELSALSKR